MQPVIYYIRHGETIWNVEGRLQGQRDSDLTARGRAQADRCAEILRQLATDDGCRLEQLSFVSSPLGRARATMERIRTLLRLDADGYRVEPNLAEMSFGAWEGFVYDEIARREPDALARREQQKWHFSPPGGESYAALMERVRRWHDTVTRDTVVVAHGGTGRALIALRGIAEPDKAARIDIEHGVVYRFAADGFARFA
jgi:broad specificity phosphatase PhoE